MAGLASDLWQTSQVSGRCDLILVITGTHTQGFDRLVAAMDTYSSSEKEKVVIQIGSSKYIPKYATWFRFLDRDESIRELMEEADVIVAHAGAGTIIDILKLGKPLVLVPRRKELGEMMDDQQLELAEKLSRSLRAVAVGDVDCLARAIESARSMKPAPVQGSADLIASLRSIIRKMEKDPQSDTLSLASKKS